MDYLSHNVAVNLKQIRQSKGMSLGEVAEQTGVSKSMLAQISWRTWKDYKWSPYRVSDTY